MKIIFVFAACLFVSGFLDAQTITWQKIFGGDNPEYGKYGIQTFDGGYIIVFLKQGNNGGTFLLKLDQYGIEQWTKLIDTIGRSNFIIQTSDSGYLLAGGQNYRAKLIKTDEQGNETWTKYYSINNEYSNFQKVRIIENGGLIMCGNCSFPSKAYFVKSDSFGNVVWQNSYSESSISAISNDICESIDGFYYTTGVCIINGSPKTLVGKISTSGNPIWFKNHGSEGEGDSENGQIIIPESENSISIGGTLQDYYIGKGHFIKYDSTGNLILEKLYESMYEFVYMTKYISGYSICGAYRYDTKINFIKINSNGVELLNSIINSNTNSFDYSMSINSTYDGGFILTGFTGPEKNNDILVIKTDSNGQSTVSINNLSNEITSSIYLDQNYPNPFNSETNIKFGIRKKGNVKLKIFNIQGKQVYTLIDNVLDVGSYTISFDGMLLQSGIYFYQLEAGNNSKTKIMIQLK